MHLKITSSKFLDYININGPAATFKSRITKLQNQLIPQCRRLKIESLSREESRSNFFFRATIKLM